MKKSGHRLLGYGLLLLGAAFAVSCGASKSMVPPPQPPDIYVAGYEKNDSSLYIAKYWKNGTPVTLGAGGIYGSVAYSIFVSGNDVYVAGMEGVTPDTVVAKYWKNGSPVALTDGTHAAVALSIFVDGTDVYVAGFDGGVAEYWKNGVPVPLTEYDGTNSAEAWSIALSGIDVYVAGWQYITTRINPTTTYTTPVAMYWKNAVPTQLSNPLGFGVAQSMFLSGNDIYVAGNSCPPNTGPGCDEATYWKNGTPVVLTTQTPTVASSIFVSGTDVYVAGSDLTGGGAAIADLWKDSTLTQLANGDSAANAVVVSGSDIYIAGANINSNGNEVAGYWKNGVFVPVTDGTHFALAFAMTVVTH